MIDDDDADRDDALFLGAFDRLAGPPPDVRAGWADLGQRALDRPTGRAADRPPAPVRTGRHAPRLAVLAAVAVTAALVGSTVRRAGTPEPTSPAAASTAAPSTAGRAATSAAGRATTSAAPATVPAVVTGGGTGATAAPAPPSDATTAPAPEGGADPTDPTPGPGRGPGSAPAAPVPTVPATPGPSAPSSAPAPTGTAVPVPQRVVVTGGVIAVPVVGGRFGPPTVTADPGWTYEIRKAEADRIEVRFRGPGGESRVRLSLGADGTVAVERG